jgi:uncharacterized BrkB/YihY/UPF0761 family membrane protein
MQHAAFYENLSYKTLYHIMRLSLNSWLDHRDSSRGAALAFYTLFSLTPILILSIAIAGYFFGAMLRKGRSFYKFKVWWARTGRRQYRPYWQPRVTQPLVP